MSYVTANKFTTPVDGEEVSRAWKTSGYSCSLFVDPPGREWNGFVHQTNELVTVLEGELEMIIGGQRMVAGPGDEIFIPKGTYNLMAHSVVAAKHKSVISF